MSYGCNTSREGYIGRRTGYWARDGEDKVWIEDKMSKKCQYDRSKIDNGCKGCRKRKKDKDD